MKGADLAATILFLLFVAAIAVAALVDWIGGLFA